MLCKDTPAADLDATPSIERSPAHALSLPDGTGYTREQIIAGLSPTVVPALAEATLHDDDPEVFRCLADLPLQQGDCPVDSLQGVYQLARNRELLGWSAPADLVETRPIIAVGSGPSLTAALPHLKRIQNAYRIVCAHSTLEALLDAGICPDAYCPTERVDPIFARHKSYPLDAVVYAGLPYVPREHERCRLKMSVCGFDPPYWWAGAREPRVRYGSSSGTLSVGVACALTTGPVYLVGHDLCGTHHRDHRFAEMTDWNALDVACVDGERRPCAPLWHRCVHTLGELAALHPIIQTASEGAAIANASHAALPEDDGYRKRPLAPVFDRPDIPDRLRAKLMTLPDELAVAAGRVRIATSITDIELPRLFGSENSHFWAGIFLSVYMQLSIERRLGRGDIVLPWFQEIFANMEDHLSKTVAEMAAW